MADHYQQLLDQLQGVRQRGDQAEARCPAHDDKRASLSVARGAGGRVLITCHKGCAWQAVLGAVGMEPSDAFGEPRLVAEYTYTDADGRPVYVVERWEPKTFRQRLANGQRRAPKAEERVLYNLPAVLSLHGHQGAALWYVEGERDVDTLVNLGYCATTTPGGAGKPWLAQYTVALAGLRVVIVADNDEPGRRWARKVAKALHPTSQTTVVVPPKGVKDVTELLEAGYTVKDMVALPDTHGEVVSAADYPIKAVEWLWPGRIPAHMLTLLEGDPGTGKSTITIELIACLTTGRPLPGMERAGPPLRIGMLADEDSFPAVVVPRLQAAGADLHRVLHFKGIRDEDGYLQPFSLAELATLRDDVRAAKVDLLIIDPLMAYLGTELDAHKDQHVRSVLGPLVQMAEDDQVTILAVRHFTKGSAGGKAIYRGGGSIGFTGQARAILQVGEYPHQQADGDQPQRYVLAVAKCNLAPPILSLAYTIAQDPRLEVSRIAWEDLAVPVTAGQLQHLPAAQLPGTGRDSPAAREAVEWLTAWVQDHWAGEPLEWKPILAAAREVGIGKNTLEKHRAEVLRLFISGPGGMRAARWLPITEPARGRGVTGNGGNDSGKWEAADDIARRLDPHGYDDEALPSPNGATSPTSHYPASPEGAVSGPVDCSICHSTDGLVIDEVGEARCRLHNPLIWSPT